MNAHVFVHILVVVMNIVFFGFQTAIPTTGGDTPSIAA